MPEPTISVLMAAYNVEKFVSKAITSILQQTHKNFELIIINDASTDSTVDVIKSFDDGRIRFHQNEENLGHVKTFNRLLSHAQGEFITFQDADDYADVRRLELQLNEFRSDPDLAICGTNLTAVRADGVEMFCSNYVMEGNKIKEQMLEGNFSMIPNSFLFKREVLQTIGLYNEFWHRIAAEDYYWTWLALEKFKMKNIKPALYYYRYNSESVTGNWLDDRRKMHNGKLLNFLFRQRLETGTDALEQKDFKTIEEFLKKLDQPYVDDPSLFYRQMARRDFYMGNKKRALKIMATAVKKNPFKTENYRDFLYFIRTKSTQRLV